VARRGWTTPARYAATARLSRAAGLPPRLSGGLGLAMRVEQTDGPGRPLDLLLTSSGRSRVTRHLPLPRADALDTPYSSLLRYRVGGRHRLPAAFPRRTGPRPVHGDPASLSDDPGRRSAPVRSVRRDVTEGVAYVAALTARTALPLRQERTVAFDPCAHSVPGLTSGSALAASRRAAYHGSRAGRRDTSGRN
jgi:hypothetical protein